MIMNFAIYYDGNIDEDDENLFCIWVERVFKFEGELTFQNIFLLAIFSQLSICVSHIEFDSYHLTKDFFKASTA